jgi:hypothetical protein
LVRNHATTRTAFMNACMAAGVVGLALSLVIPSILQMAAVLTAGSITLLVVIAIEVVQIRQGKAKAKKQATLCLIVTSVILGAAILMSAVREKSVARIAIGGVLSVADYRDVSLIPTANLEVLARAMPLSDSEALKCELLWALEMCASPLKTSDSEALKC